MEIRSVVTNTDQVNRNNVLVPASALMGAELQFWRDSHAKGHRAGMPSNLQHDMHRPIGWFQPLGLYMDGTMVRSIGQIGFPENRAEREQLHSDVRAYWAGIHSEAESHLSEIIAQTDIASPSELSSLMIEAAVAKKPDIARTLYPEFYMPSSALVDKDGLVDYRELTVRLDEIQPGVFHDRTRNLLLFAHPFFRRNLSHLNKLNADFLNLLKTTADAYSDVRVRLRLDPDIIGHPETAKNLLELEHWWGPPYSDDIASIPSGVVEHKADSRTRYYEGVDRTQFWWKAPEHRVLDNEDEFEFRTFELEELIENPSCGLRDGQFGCRYAHAEFSTVDNCITHFDGAIRSYSGDAYLNRIGTSIDRAGKNAGYTKLFRLDGILSVEIWKSLLTKFFRGNYLIPEYFNDSAMSDDIEDESETIQNSANLIASKPDLAALISVQVGSLDHSQCDFVDEKYIEIERAPVPCLELGDGEVACFFRNHFDLTAKLLINYDDPLLNLPRITMGASGGLQTKFDSLVAGLANALDSDACEVGIQRVAVPLTWEHEKTLLTLSVTGEVKKVAEVLRRLPNILELRSPSTDWIEPLSALIRATSSVKDADVMWDGVHQGILLLARSEEIGVRLWNPDGVINNEKN